MRFVAVLAVVLVACSKSQATQSTPPVEASAPIVAAVDAAPAVDASPPIRTKHYEASFAHFENSNLFECVDLLIDLEPPADAGADWKPKEDPIVAAKKGMKGATKIQQSCAEAFADRPVLASCAYGGKGDGGAVNATAHFYNFADVGLKDEQMADCLKGDGRWKAIARDSAEWRKAKLDYDRKRLRKAVDKLNDEAAE